MGAIGISEGYREVTVVDYSPNEDRSDVTTAGCAWKIAEEAAAVNHTTAEEEFDWLLEHNSDVAKNPDLVQPGQKVRVHYLKDNHEFAGAGKEQGGEKETGVPLRVEKDGKLSDTKSKDIVSYRHPIKGQQGSCVQVPVNKGSKGGDESITVWDEGQEHKIKPGESYTTKEKEIVRNFPGEEYAVTRENGETFLLNPKAEVRDAQDKNSQAYKAIRDLKGQYAGNAGNEKGIDDLAIKMAAENVNDGTQAKVFGTYGKVLKNGNEQGKEKIRNLLGSKDFHESFYKLSDKTQNEALTLLLKYAGEGNDKKFDSASRIVKNKDYQGMEEDKQIRLLTEYDKDPSFAKAVDESLDKKNSLEEPVKTLDAMMSPSNSNDKYDWNTD